MRPTNDERLPSITARDADGAPVSIPAIVEGRWAAVLLFRGHW